MANVKVEAIAKSHIEPFLKCEKCGGVRLIFGGNGDWRQTILCEDCFHTRRAIPLKTMWELIAHVYPNIPDWEAAKKVDEKTQASYQAVLAKHAVSATHKI